MKCARYILIDDAKEVGPYDLFEMCFDGGIERLRSMGGRAFHSRMILLNYMTGLKGVYEETGG